MASPQTILTFPSIIRNARRMLVAQAAKLNKSHACILRGIFPPSLRADTRLVRVRKVGTRKGSSQGPVAIRGGRSRRVEAVWG